jgi:hypothetical protein
MKAKKRPPPPRGSNTVRRCGICFQSKAPHDAAGVLPTRLRLRRFPMPVAALQPGSILPMSGSLERRSRGGFSILIRRITQRFVSICDRPPNECDFERQQPRTRLDLRGLAPLRLHILRRLIEMDVLVDMVDPSHRNEVVFPVGSIALCQLDLVFAIEMVDLGDLLSMRR